MPVFGPLMIAIEVEDQHTCQRQNQKLEKFLQPPISNPKRKKQSAWDERERERWQWQWHSADSPRQWTSQFSASSMADPSITWSVSVFQSTLCYERVSISDVNLCLLCFVL